MYLALTLVEGDHGRVRVDDRVPGERIELKHQAHSRQTLASGAVKAAVKMVCRLNEYKV